MTEASITWLIVLNCFYPSFYQDLPAPSTIGFRHLCFNKSRWWVVRHSREREREGLRLMTWPKNWCQNSHTAFWWRNICTFLGHNGKCQSQWMRAGNCIFHYKKMPTHFLFTDLWSISQHRQNDRRRVRGVCNRENRRANLVCIRLVTVCR